MSNIFSPFPTQAAKRFYRYDSDVLNTILAAEIEEKINDHAKIFPKRAVISYHIENAQRFSAEWVYPNENLQFQVEKYDLIIHMGALSVINDPIGQLIQSRMKLNPDGVFLAGFMGQDSLLNLRKAMLETDIAVYGGANYRIAPMIPFEAATGFLQRAQYTLPVGDMISQKLTYPSAHALIQDLRVLGLSNPLNARRKSFEKSHYFEVLYEKMQDYCQNSHKQYESEFDLIFLTGYAYDKNQPKPLARGSITQKFGDFEL